MTKTILLVEDTRALAESIADFLRMEGFQVTIAANGQAGIDFLGTQMVDLIITDLLMPGINGIQFIQKVRADNRLNGIPIIMLTAQTNGEHRAAGESSGADLFLTKPFEEEELLDSIALLI
jgi:DNA-binding response OmpR family regulator